MRFHLKWDRDHEWVAIECASVQEAIDLFLKQLPRRNGVLGIVSPVGEMAEYAVMSELDPIAALLEYGERASKAEFEQLADLAVRQALSNEQDAVRLWQALGRNLPGVSESLRVYGTACGWTRLLALLEGGGS